MQSAVHFFCRFVNVGFGFQYGTLPDEWFGETPDGSLVECIHKNFGAEITKISSPNGQCNIVIVLRNRESIPAAVHRMAELKHLRVLRIYADKTRTDSEEVRNFIYRGGALTEKCIQAAVYGLEKTHFWPH